MSILTWSSNLRRNRSCYFPKVPKPCFTTVGTIAQGSESSLSQEVCTWSRLCWSLGLEHAGPVILAKFLIRLTLRFLI